MRKWIWLWGPVVFYTGLIFWLSSAPRPIPGIQQFPWFDKVLHTFEYAPYGSLLTRALRRSHHRIPWVWVQLLAFLTALSVGSLDEFYQSFIPTRNSSVWDTLWDCVGAVLGQWFYRSKVAKTP